MLRSNDDTLACLSKDDTLDCFSSWLPLLTNLSRVGLRVMGAFTFLFFLRPNSSSETPPTLTSCVDDWMLVADSLLLGG